MLSFVAAAVVLVTMSWAVFEVAELVCQVCPAADRLADRAAALLFGRVR